MKKINSNFPRIIIFLIFISATSSSLYAQDTASKVYVCPMHPNETSDKPGVCSECKMNLVLKETLNNTSTKNFKKLPSVKVWDMKGNVVDVSTVSNESKPVLFLFWATWCSPCVKELNNIADLYDDWKQNYGVKIYAVSVDDSRSSAKVPSVVRGKRWEFEILMDKNQDLMRALNFQMPPFTVLLNGKSEIVWTHNSYVEGDEYELEEKIKSLTK